MTSLNLTLNPISIAKFYDALTCLSKFNETVVFEARRNKLVISNLNSTKSAYCSFTFEGGKFFDVYHFVPSQNRSFTPNAEEGKLVCQFQVKALLPVFRSRIPDAKDRDTGIEKCELSIKETPNVVQCRLIVKLHCKNGVLKTYKLQYEEVQPMHALFDQNSATNRWKINAKLMKEYMDHFGPKADHLDIFHSNGRASFTSFTEKIVNGTEVLKHPLQTCVALDTVEFEFFEVEEDLHVAINVKDFKSVITHADGLNVSVFAMYRENGRPMRLSYEREGMICEFTLMTRRKDSENPTPSSTRSTPMVSRGLVASIAPLPPSAPQSTRPEQTTRSDSTTAASSMAPPAAPPSRRGLVRKERAPSPPIRQSQSFFLMDDDNLFDNDQDGQQQQEEDEDEQQEEFDVLGWDASLHQESNKLKHQQQQENRSTSGPLSNQTRDEEDEGVEEEEEGPIINPTQQSQKFRSIFDQ